MVDRQLPLHDRPQRDARVIPLGLTATGSMRAAATVFRTGTRTIRPVEVLLLAPVIVPLVAAILLLLLGWFILWLTTVALLAGMSLIADMARTGLSLSIGWVLRALDRRAISYQGR